MKEKLEIDIGGDLRTNALPFSQSRIITKNREIRNLYPRLCGNAFPCHSFFYTRPIINKKKARPSKKKCKDRDKCAGAWHASLAHISSFNSLFFGD
jgi:hypothetical protein